MSAAGPGPGTARPRRGARHAAPRQPGQGPVLPALMPFGVQAEVAASVAARPLPCGPHRTPGPLAQVNGYTSDTKNREGSQCTDHVGRRWWLGDVDYIKRRGTVGGGRPLGPALMAPLTPSYTERSTGCGCRTQQQARPDDTEPRGCGCQPGFLLPGASHVRTRPPSLAGSIRLRARPSRMACLAKSGAGRVLLAGDPRAPTVLVNAREWGAVDW